MGTGLQRLRGNLRIAAALIFALAASACVSTATPPQMTAYSITNDAPTFVPASPPLSCVPFAREHSGIDIFGDAYTWWDQARGRYVREGTPRTGSLLVLAGYAGPKRAHLAVVTRIVSAREIRVDHANWLSDGNIFLNSPVIDVSPDNNWSEVRVFNNRDGHMGINNYAVQGFISSTRVASS